tara:strand:- start:303 stop:863 length:561 start_codon:yes stop_codon:yes gene_type:complete
MRITGGKARGIQLSFPKTIRPALDQMRERLFSSIGERVIETNVLDLFSGTGSYGLEAISRGASTATLVEFDRNSIACIQSNIKAVCKSNGTSPSNITVQQSDVLRWTPVTHHHYDIIFIDPPYDMIEENIDKLFSLLDKSLTLAPNGLIAFEMPGKLEFEPQGWSLKKRLGKGKASPTIVIYQRNI